MDLPLSLNGRARIFLHPALGGFQGEGWGKDAKFWKLTADSALFQFVAWPDPCQGLLSSMQGAVLKALIAAAPNSQWEAKCKKFSVLKSGQSWNITALSAMGSSPSSCPASIPLCRTARKAELCWISAAAPLSTFCVHRGRQIMGKKELKMQGEERLGFIQRQWPEAVPGEVGWC